MQPRARSASVRLTIRSSREWKVITASRPPGASASTAASSMGGRASSSPLTAMRMAWKLRLAGCCFSRSAAGGMAPLMISTSSRVVAMGALLPGPDDGLGNGGGVALLAVVIQDPPQLLLAPGVHHLVGRQGGGGVHPHVQRGVVHVGKAPGRVVQLGGGDAQVKEHPLGAAPRRPPRSSAASSAKLPWTRVTRSSQGARRSSAASMAA